MKMTETLNQDIAKFENATGKAVSPRLRGLIAAMAVAGDRFEDLGEQDASSGRAQRTKEAFIEWGKRELADPDGKDNPIVDLMYQCYLDGYEAGTKRGRTREEVEKTEVPA